MIRHINQLSATVNDHSNTQSKHSRLAGVHMHRVRRTEAWLKPLVLKRVELDQATVKITKHFSVVLILR